VAVEADMGLLSRRTFGGGGKCVGCLVGNLYCLGLIGGFRWCGRPFVSPAAGRLHATRIVSPSRLTGDWQWR
jgi:hypothetical protein